MRSFKCHLILIVLLQGLGIKAMLAQPVAPIHKLRSGAENWSANSSWQAIDGSSSSTPSPDAIVWIEANQPIEIEITGDVSISSLVITGKEKVTFQGSSSARIRIAEQLTVLTDQLVYNDVQLDLSEASTYHPFISDLEDLNSDSKGIVKKQNGQVQPKAMLSGPCPFFNLVPNPVGPTCNGFNNGIASVEPITGGIGPFTFQWVGGPATRQWFNVGAGTYTIIVIDIGQGGLPCNTNVFVNEPGPLTVFSTVSSPPLCADVCNGSATPIVIGGNGGYSYLWSSGETTSFATALCATYSLQVTDVAGCQLDSTFIFTNAPDTIRFAAIIDNVACSGDTNGNIDVTVTGGIPGFSYLWSGPNGFSSTSEDIFDLPAGDYLLEVIDANNCIADTVFTILENPELELSSTMISNVCFGGNMGSITNTITGGLPPYTTVWTGPDGFTSFDPSVFSLFAGTYTLTLTDDSGCELISVFEITEPAEIVISTTQSDVLCFAGNNGSAEAMAIGGTPVLTYSWTGPNGFLANGNSISGLVVGTYYILVTDGNTCTQLDSLEIVQPEELELSFIETPVSCHDGSDGAIDITVTGGVLPYTYTWSGPNGFSSASENISGLSSGIYTLILIDDNGCELTHSHELINPAAYTVTANILDVSCFGEMNGSIAITVVGGIDPYDFAWAGPNGFVAAVEDLNGLAAGEYSVEIVDQLGCVTTESYTVSEPSAIDVLVDATPVSCFTSIDGALNLTISGGTPPYSVEWTGPSGFTSDQESISSLAAGTYALVLTDFNDCIFSGSYDVLEPAEIEIDAILMHPACAEDATGSISVVILGGISPLNLNWIGPNGFTSTDANITNLESGEYQLTVIDATNCTADSIFDIVAPNQLDVDGVVVDAICQGDNNGSISITIIGGTAPYQVNWTGPDGFTSDQLIVDLLISGSYIVEVIDSELCATTQTFLVGNQFEINVNALLTPVSCAGLSDGSIDISIAGGTNPYDVSWLGPNGFSSSNEVITGLISGDYNVEIIDNNGCLFTATYTITQPDEIVLSIVTSPVTCSGIDDGEISVTASGGMPDYDYAWSGPNGFNSSSPNISGLAGGLYTLVLTDQSACSLDTTIQLSTPEVIVIDYNISLPGCIANDGSITAIPSGGVVIAGYEYSWSNSLGNIIGITNTISNLGPGSYFLSVFDDNGCMVEDQIVLVRNLLTVTAMLTPASCVGTDNGMIEITIIGGEAPFIFNWVGPNGFASSQQNISNLAAGTYQLTISDSGGCLEQYTYEITADPGIQINPVIIPEPCYGQGGGAISLNPSGGNPGYQVDWLGPNGYVANGLSISGLDPGLYTASITDSNGCIVDSILQVDPAPEYDFTFNSTAQSCISLQDGEIEPVLNAINGDASPFSYSWIGPNGYTSNNQQISNLEPGTYNLEATDVSGCVSNWVVEVLPADTLDLVISAQNANCLQSDGELSVLASGGLVDTYTWTNAAGDVVGNNVTITGIPAGTYTITVNYNLTCTAQQTTVLSDSQASLEVNPTSPLCSNSSDGAISIEISAGTPPFDYEWTSGGTLISTDQNISGLVAGIYTVLATDENGCVYGATVELIAPTGLSANAILSPVSCLGNDGSISITISGGTPVYQINWEGPDGFTATDILIDNLVVGEYVYTIQDASGCVLIDSLALSPEIPISVVEDITSLSCAEAVDGEISITNTTGGTPPYLYEWIGPGNFTANAELIANLPAGVYSLTVIDANGCSANFEFEVESPDPIEITFDFIAPDCETSNGAIQANITGGNGALGYFIQWTDEFGNPLGGSSLLENVEAGMYNIQVIDNNGCEILNTTYLSNPGATITEQVEAESCFGALDGSIDLTIEGVAAPFSIEWIGPNGFSSTDEDLSGLAPGNYNYTIIGANNCLYFGMITIEMASQILVSSVVQSSCFGQVSGSIAITITGGVEPYQISWQGPEGFVSDQSSITDLQAGMYFLTVEDGNGCIFNSDYTVVDQDELIVAVIAGNLNCFGDSSGSLLMTINGGIPPYDLTWFGPDGFTSNELALTGLSAGPYTYSIVDASLCSFTGGEILIQPDSLGIDFTIVSPGCEDPSSLGSITANIFGGTQTYSLEWIGPNGFFSSSTALTDLEEGEYFYTLIDGNNCSISGQIDLTVASPITLHAQVLPISCFGFSDGEITIEILSGNSPFEFTWTGPDEFSSTQDHIEGLGIGIYSLVITDSLGCSKDTIIEINQPELFELVLLEMVDATCNTSSDGEILVSAIGGSSPYEINWQGPNEFSSSNFALTGLFPGDYLAMATDANGCETSFSQNIDFTIEVSTDAGLDQNVCADILPVWIDGSGENIEQFQWFDIDGNLLADSSSIQFNNNPGTYELVLVGYNGSCEASDTLQIVILSIPDVDAGSNQELFAEQNFTLGGNPTSVQGISYAWSPVALGNFDATVSNPQGYLLETTTFEVIVMDANGCIAIDSTTVIILPEVEISSGFTPNNDGTNDLWVIDNMELFPNNTVNIFNRWGQILYQKVGYNSGNAWDGKFEDKDVPVGTYYYTIDLNDLRFPDPITGPITIMR